MRYAIFAIIFPLFSACATSPYAIPDGDQLRIEKELVFAADKDKLYLQRGRIITKMSHLNQEYPHCWFSITVTDEQIRTIKPDTFIVTGSEHQLRDVEMPPALPLIFRYKLKGKKAIEEDEIYYAKEHTSIMFLHSSQQPNVKSLSCRHWEYAYYAEHLNLRDIQSALGNFARIILSE